jgi:hypothetical protein
MFFNHDKDFLTLLLCVIPLHCSIESQIAPSHCSFMFFHHIVIPINVSLHCFITLLLLQLIHHIVSVVVLLCHVANATTVSLSHCWC